MKGRELYKRLDAKTENQKKIIQFLNAEKYELLIQEIPKLKGGQRKREPRDYQLWKLYDVAKIGNTAKLIYPVAEEDYLVNCYVRKEDIFGVIHDDHLAIGHDGQNQMIKEAQTKYKHITGTSIMFYLRLCVPCIKKSKVSKNELVIKSVIISEMNSRAQVDLTDMQSEPDGDLKWILVRVIKNSRKICHNSLYSSDYAIWLEIIDNNRKYE